MINMAEPRQTVRVALGERSYDILIGRGIAAEAGGSAAALFKGRRLLIVTDENVAARHLAPVAASFEAAGLKIASLVLPAGEKTKSWRYFEEVVERIITERLERGDGVVALGGGVIGDLTGFAAAVTRRGMRFIQMPTSLLAQVDSSVGGKTGINSPNGKNLVGAFHQPSLVIADTAILDTLSEREFRAGYAEVAKYGLIDRPDFFSWLEAGAWRGIFAGGPEREEAVRFSCQAKADIVARDETETGDRALLNLGHTFGHALEALVHYEGARLVHGEGVSIGMAMAHRFSAHLGLCSEADARRVEAHLRAVSLPIYASQIPGGIGDVAAMLAAIKQDKKVSGGTLTFILTRGIGQSFIAKGVEEAMLVEFLTLDLAKTPGNG
jgi:3-dehydroquinate synthase